MTTDFSDNFWKNKKITVTGGYGFLGSYVTEKILQLPIQEINIPRSTTCDLKIKENCHQAVKNKDIVIHLAGVVGGIGFNKNNPATMIYDNLLMGINLIDACYKEKVAKLIIIGTICSYPKFTPTPFKETDLWNGYPEETNAPYGLAKKMLLVQSQAYHEQYGLNSIYLLPTNLYGPRDNFNPKSSHVIPALITKISHAIKEKQDIINVWGTGKPTREFLYVDDAAEAILLATEKYNKPKPVNIGSETEISIKDLTNTIAKIMNYQGKIYWDLSKPDGQPKRKIDTSIAKSELGFTAKTSFDSGLKKTIDWYLKQVK